nr:unnamed protein product [Digitaria exilis]
MRRSFPCVSAEVNALQGDESRMQAAAPFVGDSEPASHDTRQEEQGRSRGDGILGGPSGGYKTTPSKAKAAGRVRVPCRFVPLRGQRGGADLRRCSLVAVPTPVQGGTAGPLPLGLSPTPDPRPW